ncbi:unnamed protein product [Closterium sp. NIES-54]
MEENAREIGRRTGLSSPPPPLHLDLSPIRTLPHPALLSLTPHFSPSPRTSLPHPGLLSLTLHFSPLLPSVPHPIYPLPLPLSSPHTSSPPPPIPPFRTFLLFRHGFHCSARRIDAGKGSTQRGEGVAEHFHLALHLLSDLPHLLHW